MFRTTLVLTILICLLAIHTVGCRTGQNPESPTPQTTSTPVDGKQLADLAQKISPQFDKAPVFYSLALGLRQFSVWRRHPQPKQSYTSLSNVSAEVEYALRETGLDGFTEKRLLYAWNGVWQKRSDTWRRRFSVKHSPNPKEVVILTDGESVRHTQWEILTQAELTALAVDLSDAWEAISGRQDRRGGSPLSVGNYSPQYVLIVSSADALRVSNVDDLPHDLYHEGSRVEFASSEEQAKAILEKEWRQGNLVALGGFPALRQKLMPPSQ